MTVLSTALLSSSTTSLTVRRSVLEPPMSIPKNCSRNSASVKSPPSPPKFTELARQLAGDGNVCRDVEGDIDGLRVGFAVLQERDGDGVVARLEPTGDVEADDLRLVTRRRELGLEVDRENVAVGDAVAVRVLEAGHHVVDVGDDRRRRCPSRRSRRCDERSCRWGRCRPARQPWSWSTRCPCWCWRRTGGYRRRTRRTWVGRSSCRTTNQRRTAVSGLPR